MKPLETIFESAYQAASSLLENDVKDLAIRDKIFSVSNCASNKAPIRYLLSALLAKIENPVIDTRQPYPTLGEHSFPGRTIDEDVVQKFVHKYNHPCNDTTAFLTPAFRTVASALTKNIFTKCRPNSVYYDMMDILDYTEDNQDKSKLI